MDLEALTELASRDCYTVHAFCNLVFRTWLMQTLMLRRIEMDKYTEQIILNNNCNKKFWEAVIQLIARYILPESWDGDGM